MSQKFSRSHFVEVQQEHLMLTAKPSEPILQEQDNYIFGTVFGAKTTSVLNTNIRQPES